MSLQDLPLILSGVGISHATEGLVSCCCPGSGEFCNSLELHEPTANQCLAVRPNFQQTKNRE
jgi:hypothetical protein